MLAKLVHGASGACSEPMWIEERGPSADPADTGVVCGCRRRRLLQDLFQPESADFDNVDDHVWAFWLVTVWAFR